MSSMASQRLTSFLVLLIMCAVPLQARAQGAVSGHVLDAATSAPVAEATIQGIDRAGRVRMATVSDSAGGFRMSLPAGSYTLQAERIGYATVHTQVVSVRNDETVDVAIRMGVDPIAVEPLVVRWRARTPLGSEVFQQRMQQYSRLGQGRFITRRDIEATSVGTVNELLSRDGVLRTVIDNVHGPVLLMESRGSKCTPVVFVNGIRLMVSDAGNYLSPDELEGVEIYPNPAQMPPELQGSTDCGAVALWTRTQRGNPFALRKVGMAAAFLGLGLLFIAR